MGFKNSLLIFLLFSSVCNYAQDSIKITTSDHQRLKVKNFIIPTVLIGSGIFLRDKDLKKEIYDFQQNALGDRFKFKNDGIFQYSPTAIAILGNTLGFKSKNSVEQVVTNQLVSLSISGIIGRIVKVSVNDKRPVLYGVRSFPSGHTSSAFNGATLLFLEYKDDNIWFASSGFLLGTTTAFFRLTNDKHWVADVLAGAGLGMATAFVVHYWSPNIYKYFKKGFSSKNDATTFIAYPMLDTNNLGIGLNINFK